MRERERKARACAACGEPVGAATIVAGGPYPEAPLCFGCGGERRTCEEVWAMIEARQRRGRCRATEVALDLPSPEKERCMREAGHPPPHHCPHGFHWTGSGEAFRGICGHCGADVRLTPVPEDTRLTPRAPSA